MKRLIGIVVFLGLLLVGTGCDDGKRYHQSLCILVDVSGTYADQRKEVVRIVKSQVLPIMEPGDTLMVVRIDSQSYEQDNIEMMVTLDSRPSRANAQKLGIAQGLDKMAARSVSAKHTDIPGAMMLAGEYLREVESGSRVMLIFSDMETDLPPGTERNLGSKEFENTHIVAMNVKRLKADAADPSGYRERIGSWEKRVMASGAADWRTLMNSDKLGEYLTQVRNSDA